MASVPLFVHSEEKGTIDLPQHIRAGAQVIQVTVTPPGPSSPRTTARAMVVANVDFELSEPVPVREGVSYPDAIAKLELA